MMKKVRSTIATVFISVVMILGTMAVLIVTEEASAQTTISVQRKMTIEQNMSLSEGEKNAFWPLYQEYRSAMDRVYKRNMDMINDYVAHYQDLTGDKARTLIHEYISIERAKVQLKENYIRKFSAVLPSQKVIRFFQLENRLDATIDVESSRRIPLAR